MNYVYIQLLIVLSNHRVSCFLSTWEYSSALPMFARKRMERSCFPSSGTKLRRVIVDALSGLRTRAPKGGRGSQREAPEGERLTRRRVSASWRQYAVAHSTREHLFAPSTAAAASVRVLHGRA